MKFEKGHEKKGGRKKGTPNKVGRNAKELLNKVLVELDKTIIEDIGFIGYRGRIKLWLALQAYVMAKPKPEEPEEEKPGNIELVLIDADGKRANWNTGKKRKDAGDQD